MKTVNEFIKGFDVSSLLEVEACGASFSDRELSGDALEILRGYGGNWVRLRLWNDPYTKEGDSYGGGGCDFPSVVKLAKRARALGMKWLLDFHYSDFWADPGKQIPPKAWRDMDDAELGKAIARYTAQVLEDLDREGVRPDMVQVGNEVTNGLLWPHGKVPKWDNIACFIENGVQAVRKFDREIPVMVHLDNGGNNELYRTWFTNYAERGGEWDIIGLSYYPFWHGTLDDLAYNMNDLARRFGKPMVVVETSMGFTMEDYGRHEELPPSRRKGAATRKELVDRISFPMTPEGQARFTEQLLQVIRDVPNRLGMGFFWWEAAWIPVRGSGWSEQGGWEYVHEKGPGGNEWANQALFDFEGHALPALEVIRNFESLW